MDRTSLRRTRRVVFASLVICSLGAPAEGKYGGGNGTEQSPYEIWTPQHLQEIEGNQDDKDKHFVLRADLDMLGITDFQPIPQFYGVLEGNGFLRAPLEVSEDLGVSEIDLNYEGTLSTKRKA